MIQVQHYSIITVLAPRMLWLHLADKPTKCCKCNVQSKTIDFRKEQTYFIT